MTRANHVHHEGTKHTKVADNQYSELRDLRAFVVKKSLPLGYGYAVMATSW